MNNLLKGIGALGALMLALMGAPAVAADAQRGANKTVEADDVPAPPMALLFGIGAVGLIWGRRLAANARKAREQAESSD